MKLKKIYPALLVSLPLLVAAATFGPVTDYVQRASAGYGGTDKFCPAVSMMTLTPSTLTATPSQHVDFNGRNFAIEEDIIVYLDGTPVGRAHADGGGNFTTGSITLPNVAGTYTYSFVGVNCNTPMTSVITVTGDSTGGNGNTGGNGGSQSGQMTLEPVTRTVSSGSSVDFSGRNWGHEENVTITLSGAVIGMAHADGGGNFTTGSIQTPTTPGTYVYTFTGATTNSPMTSTITVQ